MNVNSLLFAIVNAAAFMLSASFLIYIASIVVPFLRYRAPEPGDGAGFGWHFFVPCLDEERVVEQTVARLRADFPDGHVWCIDDASDDDTPRILRRLARSDPLVHVVTRRFPDARVGKGPALNAAWEALVEWLPSDADAEQVIVGVVDADGYLDPECLRVVSGSRYFGNPDISAVQIQVRVSNGDRASADTSIASRILVRMQDMEFTTVIGAIQMLRHNVGSVGMGGNGQFTRLAALNNIAAEYERPWRKALIEDFELGLHVLLTGGRNEYCHDTWVSQQGPPTFMRLVRQRSRWGQGCMQCIRYLAPVLRSPEISTGAAVEITYFLMLPWLQIVGDLVYFVALLALVYAAFTVPQGPFHWFGDAGAWQLVPLFVIFGLGPLFVWGPIYRRRVARELTRGQAIFLGLANWPYLFVHHFAVWWAFTRFVRSRHDWKKTERLDYRTVLEPAGARAETPHEDGPLPAFGPGLLTAPPYEPAYGYAALAPPQPVRARRRPRPAPARPRPTRVSRGLVVGGRLRHNARPGAVAAGRLVVGTSARVAPTTPARPVSGRVVLSRGGAHWRPRSGDDEGPLSRSTEQAASVS